MTVIMIAILHAIPILLVGFLSRSRLATNVTAILMIGVAIAMGNIALLLADLVAIGLAYAVAMSETRPRLT